MITLAIGAVLVCTMICCGDQSYYPGMGLAALAVAKSCYICGVAVGKSKERKRLTGSIHAWPRELVSLKCD